MAGWLKASLIVAGILIACYAFNINPFTVLGDLVRGIQHMHQTAVNGGH